jgi:hypothetical protein
MQLATACVGSALPGTRGLLSTHAMFEAPKRPIRNGSAVLGGCGGRMTAQLRWTSPIMEAIFWLTIERFGEG